MMRINVSPLVLSLLTSSLVGCSDSSPAPTRELAPGHIATWAGDGTQGNDGDGHPLASSWLNQPTGLSFAADGTALIIDWNNHSVRQSTPEGSLRTLIGTALPGDWPCQDPTDTSKCDVPLDAAMPATELRLNHPTAAVLTGDDGDFFLAAWHNHKILHYDARREQVTIVAGGQKPGSTGDGGPAQAALLNFPASVVLQSDGGLLVADERNNRIRRIEPDGDRRISTVVGAAPAMGTDEDGLPATQTLLLLTTTDEVSGSDNPPPGGGLALDVDGSLLISDTFHHCVRRVAPGPDGLVGVGDPADEVVSTVAGTRGSAGYAGDGDSATKALLARPFGIQLGPDGALYIADSYNHVVRKVSPDDAIIETVVGTGTPGFSGDGGPASAARIRDPYGVTFDQSGSLYVVDTRNNRIRRVAP